MKNEKENQGRVIIATMISKLGSIIFDYANSRFLISHSTQSVALMALYQGSENFLGVIANTFGGAISDRHNPKKLVILADFINGLMCLGLSFLVLQKSLIIAIYIVNLMMTLLYGFSSPATKSLIKHLVRKDNLISFNSLVEVFGQVARVAGPAIALVVVNQVGIRGSLIINGCSYLLSGVINLGLKPINQLSYKEAKKKSILRSILEGWTYLFSDGHVLSLVILSSLTNIFLAGYNLSLPFADSFFHFSNGKVYATFLIAETIGGILGAGISKWAKKLKSVGDISLWLLLSGVFLFMLPLLGLVSTNLIVLSSPIMAFNACLSIFNIKLFTFVQLRVDDAYIGRVFSSIFTSAIFLMPLGTWLFSQIMKVKSVTIFYVIGGGIIIISLIYLIGSRLRATNKE